MFESKVDTDKVNPEKVTYNPGSTTEEDTKSELSVLSTPPLKRTYTEVASSLYKGRGKLAASGAKAAPAAKPTKPAPAKLVAAQPKVQFDSAREFDSTRPSQLFNPQTPAPLKQSQ